MTITTVTARNTFDGNGSTLPFNTDFQFFKASDLVVTLVVDATAVETLQVLTTDYTVSGGAVNNQPATGTVTMVVAPPNGETLVVERVQPFTQALIDLLTGGKFPSSTIEAGYDHLTLLIQQVLDAIRRSPQVPKTTDPTAESPIIPVPVVDEVLVGKSATEWQGKTIGQLDPASITVPISIADGGSNANNIASARTNWGLGTAAVVDTGTGGTDVPTNDQITGTPREYSRQQSFDAQALSDGANIAWDVNQRQVAKVTLGGNRTLDNPTQLKDGSVYILTVTQDGTGSRTLAYGAVYKFPFGSAPVLSTGANDVDVLTFISDGTNMYGVVQQDFS